MRLVFCIDAIKNSGGMERVLCNRVNYLYEKYGFEIYIVTTDNNNEFNKNLKSFYHINNKIKIIDLEINYYNESKNKVINKINRFLKKKNHLKKIEKIINEIRPDILISMGDGSRDINYKVKYNCKKILENHFNKQFFYWNSFYYRIKRIIFGDTEKRLIDKYDEFIVLTEEDKKQWGNDKIKVINNPLTFYSEKTSNLNNKKVISAGRLEYQKGYDILIDVWKIVTKKCPDWFLEIYGEGNQKEKLQKKINDLGLEKNIFLKGNTKNIKEKFLESSIYVMSSRYEGFGLVLIEAEHCGLPLISFKCPCGPSDIIQNKKNGFLCDVNDINEMANYIIKLIENEDLRIKMGKNAREDSYKYSVENIMEEWKNLYEGLIKKN